MLQIAVQLLDLGVSLDALRLGQEELWMPARRGFHVRNVLRAVQHMTQRGQSILVHGRLLMTVFYVCCLITYEGDALQLASEDFGEAQHTLCFCDKLEALWEANICRRNAWLKLQGFRLAPQLECCCKGLPLD